MPGTGLFTAKPAVVRLRPQREPRGIVFATTGPDAPGGRASEVPARIAHLQQVPGLPGRNTVLGGSPAGPFVITTEHILSALTGMGITDCLVELEGMEVPILDGSARVFADLIAHNGAQELGGSLEPIVLGRPLRVEGPGGASIAASPRSQPGCSYTYRLDYSGTPGAEHFQPQSARWDGGEDVYRSQVAPARTFCLVPEALALRKAGLFQHVSPQDMLVLDASGRPVDSTLRFEDEPARHKLLDLIGDMALVGRPIQADITAHRAGHALNHAMCRMIIESIG